MKGTRHEELLSTLREIAQKVVADVGLELVELSLRGSSRRRLLRVDIDRAGPQGVGLEDCQRVSAILGETLDHRDVLEGGYVLEVSSPGLDRPIVSPEDYRRNAGRRIIVHARDSTGERRQWRGVLLGLEGDHLRLKDDDAGEVTIRVDGVESARQDVEF